MRMGRPKVVLDLVFDVRERDQKKLPKNVEVALVRSFLSDFYWLTSVSGLIPKLTGIACPLSLLDFAADSFEPPKIEGKVGKSGKEGKGNSGNSGNFKPPKKSPKPASADLACPTRLTSSWLSSSWISLFFRANLGLFSLTSACGLGKRGNSGA